MKRNLLRFVLLSAMSLITLSASAQQGGTTPDKDYLCFTANTAGSTVALFRAGTYTTTPTTLAIEYSTDGSNWSPYTIGTIGEPTTITLENVGDKVYFRNAKPASEVTSFSPSKDDYYQFQIENDDTNPTNSIAASGNVMSLVDVNCATTTIPCNYCFYKLFNNCSALTSAPTLPATTLTEGCYHSMFYYCSQLATAPTLPATELAASCYRQMFSGCKALTTVPELPATTLASDCYYQMFYQCTVLTTASITLPATKMESQCCYGMFYGCTALTSAPELPATTLAASCYYQMFYKCGDLTTAPELPATTLANNCYQYMFRYCESLTTAPELPATTLVASCYSNMFNGCSKLNDMKVAFIAFSTNASGSTNGWTSSVSKTGTFYCPGGLDTTSSSTSKNPSGWTVQNTYDLAITSETGWASMCVNLPLTVPEGVEVYYASAVDGNTITLTQIPENTVMAPRTAVIVKGTKDATVSFPIAGEAGTSFDNLFQGSSVAKACKAEENYVLNASKSSDDNVHFSIYTGTSLGAHKAYLPKSALSGATGAIQFRFDDATAISTVEMESSDDAIYNLAGQRVSSDYRGIVIKNGKKTWNN